MAAAQPSDRQNHSSGDAHAGRDDGCTWVFARYEASAWEEQWYRGEQSGERTAQPCQYLTSPEEVERSVRLIRAVQGAVLRREPMPPSSLPLFSRMVYAERCGHESKSSGRLRAQLIEPLVGLLRDPLTICPRPPGVPDDVYQTFAKGEDAGQSKRHYLIGPAAAWTDSPQNPASWRIGGFGPWERIGSPPSPSARARSRILMDLGASVYSGWHGIPASVGASWIVERSHRHKVDYDWIVSFEVEKLDPDLVFAAVPDEILPHYIYFNQGVEKAAQGRWNPWRILRGMGVTPDDYVVVKLDIDNLEVEDELADQIIKSATLQGLIDEVFFERHAPTAKFKDTYRLFTDLRAKGIRMHSWP